MIRYTLKCAEDHRFESWFQSAEAFDTLAAKGMVSCAVCGSSDVSKAIMAPRVGTKDNAKADGTPTKARPLTDGTPHPAEQMLRALRKHVEENSTYVGGNFATEARAMHLGETEQKPIHGEAAPEEAKSLIEDGIEIAPLPIIPPDKTS